MGKIIKKKGNVDSDGVSSFIDFYFYDDMNDTITNIHRTQNIYSN